MLQIEWISRTHILRVLELSYTNFCFYLPFYAFFSLQHECICACFACCNSTYIHELRLTCMCDVHSVKSNCKRRDINLEQLTTKNNRQHDLCQFIQYKIDKIKHYSFGYSFYFFRCPPLVILKKATYYYYVCRLVM